MRYQKVLHILTIIGTFSLFLGLILFFLQPVGIIEIDPGEINYVLLGFSFGFTGVGVLTFIWAIIMFISLTKPGPVQSFRAPSSSPEERQIAQERYKERVQEALNTALGKQKEITPNEVIFAVESTSYTKDDFCMVCKLTFKRKGKILQCPVCESLYHKEHLLAWIRVHKNCPVCSQKLFETKS